MHLIKTMLCLALLITSTSFSETQQVSPPFYTRAHLVSTTLWAEHIEVFKKHLLNDPETAHTELQNVAKKLFNRHILAEEWVPLYFRISLNGTEYISDVRRLSELEIRMLTAIDAQKYFEHIRQHQAVLTDSVDASKNENHLPDTAQEMKKKKNLRAEKISEYAASYQKLLPERPEAAHAELVKYADVTFGEHALREKWIALYFRLSREKEATVFEFIQILALAQNMLKDNLPKIAAEAILLLDSTLRAIPEQHRENAQKLPFKFSLGALK